MTPDATSVSSLRYRTVTGRSIVGDVWRLIDRAFEDHQAIPVVQRQHEILQRSISEIASALAGDLVLPVAASDVSNLDSAEVDGLQHYRAHPAFRQSRRSPVAGGGHRDAR